MVAIFVMDTKVRVIALEDNGELSHKVDASVGEWDILEFYYNEKLVYYYVHRNAYNTDSHLTSKFQYILYP